MLFVNSQIIRALVNFLIAQGLEKVILLQLISADTEQLDNGRYNYPLDDYETLISYGATKLNNNALGLLFGRSLSVQSWGLLGHIALVSSSLNKVVLHAQKLHSLVRNVGTIQLTHQQHTSTLQWQPKVPIHHYMVDELFSSWLAFAKQYCQHNSDLALVQVELMRPNPEPKVLKKYQAYFACPVIFNATSNCLVFNSSLLNSPLNSPNSELEQILTIQAQQFINEDDYVSQLKALIAQNLPLVYSVSDAAALLNIPTRSLQRHLKAQQTSYSKLLDDTRKHQSRLLFEQGISALEIASKLGFSEQSALQRAFKRWYQCSPKKFFAKTGKS